MISEKNNGEKPICSEVIDLDWYDGWMTGILKSADSSEWYIFNCCLFDPAAHLRYFSLVQTSEEFATDFKLKMGKNAGFEELMKMLKNFFDAYDGNVFLLKGRQIDEEGYEIVEIPKSSVSFFSDIGDTFEQDEKSAERIKSYFTNLL